MLICPACSHENSDACDSCAECGTALYHVTEADFKGIVRMETHHDADCDRKHTSRQPCNSDRATRIAEEQGRPQPTSTAAQEVLEYRSQADFDFDRSRWLDNGWRIANISDRPQRAGIGRVVALGFVGALVWKPGAHVYVLYERAASAPGTPQDDPSEAQPRLASTTGNSSARSANLTDELERLAALHERGALTDDEFANAKRKLVE